MIVGIDPAEAGAMTLLDEDGIALAVLSWRIRQKDNIPFYDGKLSLYSSKTITQFTAMNGGEIAINVPKLAGAGVLNVACEDGFINMTDLQKINTLEQLRKAKYHNKSANPQAGLRVCRFGGACIGALIGVTHFIEELEMGQFSFITAQGWRAQLLNVPVKTKSAKCKEISLTEIPKLIPSINHHLELHGQLDHITDSAGVAFWMRKVRGVV